MESKMIQADWAQFPKKIQHQQPGVMAGLQILLPILEGHQRLLMCDLAV